MSVQAYLHKHTFCFTTIEPQPQNFPPGCPFYSWLGYSISSVKSKYTIKHCFIKLCKIYYVYIQAHQTEKVCCFADVKSYTLRKYSRLLIWSLFLVLRQLQQQKREYISRYVDKMIYIYSKKISQAIFTSIAHVRNVPPTLAVDNISAVCHMDKCLWIHDIKVCYLLEANPSFVTFVTRNPPDRPDPERVASAISNIRCRFQWPVGSHFMTKINQFIA